MAGIFIPIVEPGLFDPDEAEVQARASFLDPRLYASYHSTPFVLDEACRILGVTLYQLGRLLGISEKSNIYLWHKVKWKRRMSQKYALRLVALYGMHCRGVPLAGYEEIDWTTGQAMESTKNGKSDRRIPKTKRRGV